MSITVRGLVFDLDGTLIDSRGDITRAVNHVLECSGRAALPLTTVTSFVGDGAAVLMQRATQLEPSDTELERLCESFRDYYAAHATEHTLVYPGVRETLNKLRTSPYRVALCTNKPRVITNRVLEELHLLQYFEATVCADDLPFKKPHPAPLLEVARKLDLNASELVMIGDGPQDILCGKAAGAHTIGVTYGIKPKDEVIACNPDHVIDSFEDVMKLLG